jgi:hypothetical protein
MTHARRGGFQLQAPASWRLPSSLGMASEGPPLPCEAKASPSLRRRAMVDISKLNSKSSKQKAIPVAKELARQCKLIKSTFATDKEVIMVGLPKVTKPIKTDAKNTMVVLAASAYTAICHVLKDSPRAAFMYEVGAPFGGVQISGYDDYRGPEFVARSHEDLEVIKRVLKDNGKEKYNVPVKSIVLIPMMEFIKEDGETPTYSWQFFTQETSGRGAENAAEVYSTTEAGVKLSLGFFSLDNKVGQNFPRIDAKTRSFRDPPAWQIGVQKLYLL